MNITTTLKLFVFVQILFGGGFCFAAITNADLNDCKVLTANKNAKEFNAYLSALKHSAEGGKSADEAALYFALSNNRFVCFQEALGVTEWSTIIEDETGVKEHDEPPPANLNGNIAAEQALRDLVYGAILNAQYQPYSGVIAASYILRYQPYFKEGLRIAYQYASRSRAFYCRYQRPKRDNSDWRSRCEESERYASEVGNLLDKSSVELMDIKALEWSDTYALKKQLIFKVTK